MADSESVSLRSWKSLVTDPSLVTRDVISGNTAYENAQHLFSMLRESETIEDVVARKLKLDHEALLGGSAPAMPGLAVVVRTLSAHYPLAIVSSSDNATITAFLNANDLAENFNFIIGSSLCGKRKPDPEPYLRALHQAEIPIESALHHVAIEDSTTGFRSAKSAGLSVVSFGESPVGLDGAVAHVAEFEPPKQALDILLGLVPQ